MSALAASLIMSTPIASGKRRADSPHPNVHGMNEREVIAHGNGWTCTETVCCARCHLYMPGVRTNSVLVNVGDKAWKNVWHRKSASFQQFLDCVRDTDTYVGRKSLVSQDAKGELLANYSEIYLYPRLRGGKKPTAKAVAKVAKMVKAVKKVKKAVKKVKRAKNQVTGKGDFFSDVWKKGKTLLGQGLHKGIDFLSNRAKDAVGHLIGSGDYHMSGEAIKSNSLYSGAAMVPTFQNSSQHGTIVCHREAIALVSSTTGFALTSITLNPGLSNFPWLNRIAPAWQRYKVHGAIIEWIPRVPEISTNAGGSVVLSTRYDLTTAAPRSIIEAEIGFGAITARPMDKMAMPIECKNSMNPTNVLNVRFGASLPTGANAQFFDHCIIDIATFGQASAGAVIGEVFITYDIEFMMPTAEQISNSGVQTYCAWTNISTANPVGTSWTVRPNSTLSATVSIGGTLSFDFDDVAPLPVGSTWLFLYSTQATGNITTNVSPSLGVDLSVYSQTFKSSAGVDVWGFASGVPSLTEICAVAFRVNSATGAQQIVLSLPVLAAAATGYSTVMLVPLLSTLTLEEQMMRHRFPKLYETEDMLTEMRELKMQLNAASGNQLPGAIPGGPSVDDETDSDCDSSSDEEEAKQPTPTSDKHVAFVDTDEWLEFLHYKSMKQQFLAKPVDDHTSLTSEKSGFISIKQ